MWSVLGSGTSLCRSKFALGRHGLELPLGVGCAVVCRMNLELKTRGFDWLRLMSLLDGISFLVLLGIAMPLKYLMGWWQAVRLVGSLHGLFFVALCGLLVCSLVRGWLPFKWAALTFGCAFIPFAPFFLDRRLRAFNRS